MDCRLLDTVDKALHCTYFHFLDVYELCKIVLFELFNLTLSLYILSVDEIFKCKVALIQRIKGRPFDRALSPTFILGRSSSSKAQAVPEAIPVSVVAVVSVVCLVSRTPPRGREKVARWQIL